MISAESDDPWKSLAVLGQSKLAGSRGRLPHEHAVVSFFNLLEGEGVVIAGKKGQIDLWNDLVHLRGDRNISTI